MISIILVIILQAVGIVVTWLVFFFQFVLLYFHEDNKKNSTSHPFKSSDNENGIRFKKETFKFFLVELGYIILLILAFFGCVSQFRSYWKLIEVYFLPGNYQRHFDCIFNVLFYIINF